MAGNVSHLTMKEILDFLDLSRQDFVRKEGRLFPEFPKNTSGRRYCDIYELAVVYSRVWGVFPKRIYVADFLFDIGYVDEDKANLVLNRLMAKGYIQ